MATKVIMSKPPLALSLLILASVVVGLTSKAQALEDEEPSIAIEVQTGQVDLSPTATDYRYSSIEKLNAIALRVVSNVAYKVIVAGDDTGGLRNVDVNIRRSGTSGYVNLSGGMMKDLFPGSSTTDSGSNHLLDLKVAIPHANNGSAYRVGNIYSNEITFTVVTADE